MQIIIYTLLSALQNHHLWLKFLTIIAYLIISLSKLKLNIYIIKELL